MPWRKGRLADAELAPSIGEEFRPLSGGNGWRIEQILSGQLQVPVEERLDHDEWVLVVGGRALMEVDGERVDLEAGDWLHLEAGVPHRVLMTDLGTSWLAIHVGQIATGHGDTAQLDP